MDPSMEARVWQRVQGSAWDPGKLIPLAGKTRQAAAEFLQLSRYFQGEEAAALRQLSAQALERTACLKGMYHMRTGEELPSPRAQSQSVENVRAALRQCYIRSLERAADLDAGISEPEFGASFSLLAKQERLGAQRLLILIGNFKSKK